jgi:hypothetical protein
MLKIRPLRLRSETLRVQGGRLPSKIDNCTEVLPSKVDNCLTIP